MTTLLIILISVTIVQTFYQNEFLREFRRSREDLNLWNQRFFDKRLIEQRKKYKDIPS